MKYPNLLQKIASALALSERELMLLVAKAPYSYKTYKVDKKTTGKRVISQPARETKYLQRILVDSVFSELPVHDCATAYSRGSSIKKNADKHRLNQYFSKFDFKNFFGSITEGDLIKHFTKHLSEVVAPDSYKVLSRISCINYKDSAGLVLSVGAPSSPLLSNSIMYEFDCMMHAWCEGRGLTYTRYADDLTFSTNEKGLCFEIERAILGILNGIEYPRLSLNDSKTIHVSKKGSRRITGIVVNNGGQLSLGRDKKRLISAMIHGFMQGRLDAVDVPKLQGLLGFAEDVEPLFCSRMRAKYGIKVMSELFQYRTKKDN